MKYSKRILTTRHDGFSLRILQGLVTFTTAMTFVIAGGSVKKLDLKVFMVLAMLLVCSCSHHFYEVKNNKKQTNKQTNTTNQNSAIATHIAGNWNGEQQSICSYLQVDSRPFCVDIY